MKIYYGKNLYENKINLLIIFVIFKEWEKVVTINF